MMWQRIEANLRMTQLRFSNSLLAASGCRHLRSGRCFNARELCWSVGSRCDRAQILDGKRRYHRREDGVRSTGRGFLQRTDRDSRDAERPQNQRGTPSRFARIAHRPHRSVPSQHRAGRPTRPSALAANPIARTGPTPGIKTLASAPNVTPPARPIAPPTVAPSAMPMPGCSASMVGTAAISCAVLWGVRTAILLFAIPAESSVLELVASRPPVQFSGFVPTATYGLTCIALDATGFDPAETATCWGFMPATGAGLDATHTCLSTTARTLI